MMFERVPLARVTVAAGGEFKRGQRFGLGGFPPGRRLDTLPAGPCSLNCHLNMLAARSALLGNNLPSSSVLDRLRPDITRCAGWCLPRNASRPTPHLRFAQMRSRAPLAPQGLPALPFVAAPPHSSRISGDKRGAPAMQPSLALGKALANLSRKQQGGNNGVVVPLNFAQVG